MASTKATLLSVEDAPAPVEQEKSYDQMSAEEQRATFVRKVMAERAEAALRDVPSPPTPLTERQRAQIEAEMEAGRNALAKHRAALEAQQGKPVERDPTAGTSTPVFRPEDYVPNLNQGKTASGSARVKNL